MYTMSRSEQGGELDLGEIEQAAREYVLQLEAEQEAQRRSMTCVI